MRISKSAASKATDIYAGELYVRAAEDGVVDDVDTALCSFAATVRNNAQLRWALGATTITGDTKREIVATVLSEGGYDPLKSVIATMVEMDHLQLIRDVAERFSELAEEKRGVAVVRVTTAVELTDGLRSQIKEKLEADVGKPVVLREKVDGAIIGGIVIDMAGRVLDGSVKTMLENARLALTTAKSGGEA